jgi:hypothetical protein
VVVDPIKVAQDELAVRPSARVELIVRHRAVSYLLCFVTVDCQELLLGERSSSLRKINTTTE